MSAPTALRPVPIPITVAVAMMSRGLPSRRHCSGQGRPVWNPEPEVSCFQIQEVVTLELDSWGAVQKPWPLPYIKQFTATGQIPPLKSNVPGPWLGSSVGPNMPRLWVQFPSQGTYKTQPMNALISGTTN